MSTRSAAVSRPRPRITARAAVFVTLVTLLSVMAISPVRLYLEQRDQIQRLERQTAELVASNEALDQRLARLKDPAYVERLARECLGMVRRGETAFVVVRKGEQPEPTSC